MFPWMKQDLRWPQLLGMALEALVSKLVWPDVAVHVQVCDQGSPDSPL